MTAVGGNRRLITPTTATEALLSTASINALQPQLTTSVVKDAYWRDGQWRKSSMTVEWTRHITRKYNGRQADWARQRHVKSRASRDTAAYTVTRLRSVSRFVCEQTATLTTVAANLSGRLLTSSLQLFYFFVFVLAHSRTSLTLRPYSRTFSIVAFAQISYCDCDTSFIGLLVWKLPHLLWLLSSSLIPIDNILGHFVQAFQDTKRSTETIWNSVNSSWKAPFDNNDACSDVAGISSKLHIWAAFKASAL